MADFKNMKPRMSLADHMRKQVGMPTADHGKPIQDDPNLKVDVVAQAKRNMEREIDRSKR